MTKDSFRPTTPEYEAPRLEPAAFRGPHARVTGGPVDAWNIVCNECSSGNN